MSYKEKAARPVRAIAGTTQQLAAAVTEYRDTVDALEEMGRRYDGKFLAEQGTDARIAQQRADAREKLLAQADKIRTKAEQQLEKARDATKRKSPPIAEKAHSWDQIRRQLDADFDPTSIAERLAKRGDLLALQVLQEELPQYLELHCGPGESLNAAFDGKTETYIKAIREVETKVLPDEDRAYRTALAEAKTASSYLTTNVQLVEREANGIDSVPMLLGIDGDRPMED